MAPQRRLAFYLRSRCPYVTTKTFRKMSVGLMGKDLTGNLNSQSAAKNDRTWQSSRGIRFQKSERKTWNPNQGLQFSSSERLSSLAPTQYVELHENSYCGGEQESSLAQRNSTFDSGSEQGLEFSKLSLSEALSPREPLCSSDSVIRNKTNPGANCPVSPSDGNEDAGFLQSINEPFRTPRGFHIPEAKFKSARDAAPSSPSAYWQYRLYQGPDGVYDKVKVHYCKNKDDTERVAQLYLDEDVVGFDIEWKVNAGAADGIRKNVSLIQIASESRIALFHIARYPNASGRDDFVAPSLKKLMESPEITKVGVAIKGDCTRLRNHLDIQSRGLFELSHLYRLVKYSSGDVKKINKTLVSLADQVQEHFDLPLWKGEVRSSDWSQDLNHQQVQYAASDSYAGFQLFHLLENKRNAMHPSPPRPAHAELNLPIKLADGQSAIVSDATSEIVEDLYDTSNLSSSISMEELAQKVTNVGFQQSSSDPFSQNPGRSSTKSAVGPSKSNSTGLPPSPELALANIWIEQFKTSANSVPSAKPAELRAYALWHEQELDVPTIASLLREPPLQNSTVTNYVGRAIQSMSLPYKLDRIKELEQYNTSTNGIPGVNWNRLRQGSGKTE